MKTNELKLVVAEITGEIYLTTLSKTGFMGEPQIEFTNEAVRSVFEWFMRNKRKVINMKKHNDEKIWMFFTEDKSKAERILAILEENNNENE